LHLTAARQAAYSSLSEIALVRRVLDFGCRMWDFGCRMSDFGFRMINVGLFFHFTPFILHFTAARLAAYSSLSEIALVRRVLDFGFWILDVGCGMSDVGFRM
jgi:hypothetical protein